jgi:dTDP-4-dehydrorhamnose 3,5-epimerase
MKVSPTKLEGVLIIEPKMFRDDRGFFLETFSARRYEDAGIKGPFVQDNVSLSSKGVLRGLHYQSPKAQGKLVSALAGEIFDVVVDIRTGSKTFGQWQGVNLSAESGRQVWIPPGLAHGFLVLSEQALFSYKCTEYYAPECERAILWSDPDLGIEWPMTAGVTVSSKDAAAPRFSELKV